MKSVKKGFTLKRPDRGTLNALQNFKIDHEEKLIDISDDILKNACDIESNALEVMRKTYNYHLQYIIT